MTEQNHSQQLNVTNDVTDRLSAGINIYNDISLKSLARLMETIENRIPQITAAHAAQLPPGFSFSRRLYRAFSTDPTKHRPSSEALWRRVKKGVNFPFVNPYVDLTNVLSLQYQVCYGLYDIDKLEGDIFIRQGDEGDAYQGIRKDNVGLEGRISLRDNNGPFGNPSSDSLRTATSTETNHLLQVLFFHPEDKDKEKILAETHQTFIDFFNVSQSASYLL